MNLTDLHAEFERQAQDAPDVASLAASAERSFTQRDRRRRNTSLLAAAAAVVALVGGVALGVNHFRSGGSAPAGPPPVVSVPQVRLPDDTQLIRHQLPEVTSPVSAVVPPGMSGTQWIDGGDRLSVGYFAADGRSTNSFDDAGSATPRSLGYVITPAQDDPLTIDGTATEVTTTPTVVGGHGATLVTAPAGAVDAFGFPAERRLGWQLGDGRWIHVWADGSDDPKRLESFAGGISEQPTTLIRTIGVGVSLPGLTEEWAVNSTVVDGSTENSVYLCPPGVNLWAPPQEVTDSGSGSAPAPDATDTAGTAASAAPDSSGSPISRCLGAVTGVMTMDQLKTQGGYTEMSVDGQTVLVDDQHRTAVTDLGNGLLAVVGSPADSPLSPDDLAAAVLSVRVSPAVVVVPGSEQDPGVVVTESASLSSIGPLAPTASSGVATSTPTTG